MMGRQFKKKAAVSEFLPHFENENEYTADLDTTAEYRSSVDLYFDDVRQTPLLDREEMIELAKAVEAGLMAQYMLEQEESSIDASDEELIWLVESGERAKEHLINANLQYVISLARNKASPQMPLMDIVQEGNIGLIRAVEKFDYKKGNTLLTYSKSWIKKLINEGIADQARTVRLPRGIGREVSTLTIASRELEQTIGRAPSPDEIATKIGAAVGKVTDLMLWRVDHVSLDTPVGEDGDTPLGNIIVEEDALGIEEGVVWAESNTYLTNLLKLLDERSADIVRQLHATVERDRPSLNAIAAQYGISSAKVRAIERQAMHDLRLMIDPDLNVS